MMDSHGYPLSYELLHTRIDCACGEVLRTSRLYVLTAESSNPIGLRTRRKRPAGLSEPMYALPVTEMYETGGTSRCASCIDAKPRIPLPDNHRVLRTGSDLGPTMRRHWGDAQERVAKPHRESPSLDSILKSIKL